MADEFNDADILDYVSQMIDELAALCLEDFKDLSVKLQACAALARESLVAVARDKNKPES